MGHSLVDLPSTQGWCTYAYYTSDPFILASNLPGLILSLWLNQGAAKLQYFEVQRNEKDRHDQRLQRQRQDSAIEDSDRPSDQETEAGPLHSSTSKELLVLVDQEVLLLRIMIGWAFILIWVGWLHPVNQAETVGLIANVNVIVFFGSPLQSIRTIIRDKRSDCIHIPTMIMNILNCSFWTLYGVARQSFVILFPNATGLMLGLTQGLFCVIYPRSVVLESVDTEPLLLDSTEE